MTEPQKSQPQSKPLIERKTRPLDSKKVDTRGMLSIATMLVSLAAITIAMFGGSKLIYDILERGLDDVKNIPVKIIVLAFSFSFGWVTGLVSIRGFGNMLYPIIIKIYAWGCLVATCYLYFKIILKLFNQNYSGQKFGTYLVILLGILFVIFCLHLLVEGHDLRAFAIPLLIISVIHLFIVVYRFVFTDDTGGVYYALGDFIVFLLMITISGLMLLHIGIFSPVRDSIGGLFTPKNKETTETGKINGVR
jgi:hypothetical protein